MRMPTSSLMIFSVRLERNQRHGKERKTFCSLSQNAPMKADLHLLKQKLSFSLLPSRIKSHICLSEQKYVKVVKFIRSNGMQW